MKFRYSYLLFSFILIFIKSGYSQFMAGPLGTNSLSNNTAAGTSWGYSPNSFASCFLNPYSYSKGLVVKNFGFSLPSTASVTGVKAAFSYSSTNWISDTIIRLTVNNIEVGNNKATNSTLLGLSTTYGASGDLWGTTILTSTNVNSANFGFVIYVKNPNPSGHDLSAMPSTTTGITFVMTVYYLNAAGIVESQRSSFEIEIYPQPAGNRVNISLDNFNEPVAEIKITDVTGKIVHSKNTDVENGKVQIETSEFANGVYFLQLISKNQIAIKRFVVAK